MSSACDVVVVALRRTGFGGEEAAAMGLLEVAVGELVMRLGIGILVDVDAEIPPRVLLETVLLDEAVLVLGRRLMFAPVVSVVEDELPVVDQSLGVIERRTVELHCHVDLLV